MNLVVIRRLLLLICGLLGGMASAQAQDVGSREQAIAGLSSDNVGERHLAIRWFARSGNFADADLLMEHLADEDDALRADAEGAVWVLWSRSGDDEIDKLLQGGIHDMNQGRMAQAVDAFTRVIERKPEFAEAWNKRATAYYLMDDLDQSLKDCDEVIKRNPNHFGALSGMAQIHIILGHPEHALEAYEKAVRINPNLPDAEANLKTLRDAVSEKKSKTV